MESHSPPVPGPFRPPLNGGQQQQQQQQQRPGGQGPPPQFMPMPIRQPLQQSTRFQDITPQKVLDEATCLQKLTSYTAFTMRKVPPRDTGEKSSWARVDVIEEHFLQEEIIKQIKKLNESKRTVSNKKAALAPFQQGQFTRLLDDLGSKEIDPSFHWSLVQIDSKTKPVASSRNTSKKSMYETVTMTAYVKRAPLRDLDPIQLYHNIERMKAERLRPPPPPQQQPRPPQQQQQQGGGGQGGYPGVGQPGGQPGRQGGGFCGPPGENQQQGGNRIPPPPPAFMKNNQNGPPPPGNRNKPQVMKQQQKGRENRAPKKYHKRNSSSGSSTSDSSRSYDSRSDSSDEESSGTTISSATSKRHERHSKSATRSHGYHRKPGPRYHLESRSPSPHHQRASDAFGGIPVQHRPYVPDVPRAAPVVDPITSAYRAGKEDAMAERFGANRYAQQPQQIIQPVIERIVPRPVVSYGRMESPFPRFTEPRYFDDRYVDDLRSVEDNLILDQRRVEEYINRRPELGRREPIEFLDRRTREFERRPHERPEIFERRYAEARPFERREATQEFFDPSPYSGQEFPRHHSPPRKFAGDTHSFAPTRRYPPSSNSSTYDQGW